MKAEIRKELKELFLGIPITGLRRVCPARPLTRHYCIRHSLPPMPDIRETQFWTGLAKKVARIILKNAGLGGRPDTKGLRNNKLPI
ncbi:MAG: hypothetical protein J5I98_11625 [Phaeodactylibacter sp.]|nr:hypothetical protein [Phaeodactylibacter sp.]